MASREGGDWGRKGHPISPLPGPRLSRGLRAGLSVFLRRKKIFLWFFISVFFLAAASALVSGFVSGEVYKSTAVVGVAPPDSAGDARLGGAGYVIFAAVFGLFAGAVAAYLWDCLDGTIREPSEAEKYSELPLLGLIPEQRKLYTPEQLCTLSRADLRSPMAEAFRCVGAFIQFSSSSARPPKVVLVTSPGKGEGKSTISSNTAIVLTRHLGRGVIIDADFRRPNLHRKFQADNYTGLSNFLAGGMKFHEGLIKKTSVEELDIITSGPASHLSPSELLGSERMRRMLHALNGLYNFILIDSTPVMGMSESMYLSSLADGVIMVARPGQTGREALIESARLLRRANARLLGVVLNGVREDCLRYGRYSNYISSYYYENNS